VWRTIKTGEQVGFALGKKATKALGSSKRVWLAVDVVGRRGKSVVGGRHFRFQLVRP
jgi:hypothetical protein